ncbi:MAG: tetratricopeptide repeat protein [Planctomycetes bacterium]|nr:tetratricopeptide repeat protein [Planctomycetota bacterium]
MTKLLHRVAAFLLAACAFLGGDAFASPPRGSPAPPITLKNIEGVPVSTEQLAPRALVLVFGEINHEGARQACGDVVEVMADPRFPPDSVAAILLIAGDTPAPQIKDQLAKGRFPATVLLDPKREAFGAYRVLVIPTIVVIDGKGKVVYAMPAYLQKSKEMLAEAILVAIGKEPPEQFEQSIDPKAGPETHQTLRADRLAHLGGELTKHGLYEMAEARYTEATTLVPGHVAATIGLGELMLRQDRLAEAEPLFRSVLTAHPDSLDAALGIAGVQLRRGGDDLTKAYTTTKALIDKNPKDPKARYVMGMVLERRSEPAAALAEYKKAAELLLDR